MKQIYIPAATFIYQRNSSWAVPYTFSGKEKDAETGYSYFGARYYDSDLSVWLSVDPLADKYLSTSGFMYVMGNPIGNIDPNGLENIVVVGNQGESPNSDRKYKNRKHFLEAALNEAKRLVEDGEVTTMLVHKGNYTDDEIESYRDRANKLGISLLVINDVNEVISYINTKRGLSDPRSNDLITDLVFVSHGNQENIFIGNWNGTGKRTLSIHDVKTKISATAFSKKSIVKLNSCKAAWSFYGNNTIARAFTKLVGKVLSSSNPINWGPGLGEFSTNLPNIGGDKWLEYSGHGGVEGPIQLALKKYSPKIQN
jgi:RHS repeat-associated protein